ncbi:MAG: redoxin domain-containing protein [Actinobacteria bacterium]|nr:redoxin domain-containing protein [Actinomycetota bacterium]
MRSLTPRPILLALTLLLIVGAIAFVELRFNTSAPDNTQAAADPPPAEQASEQVKYLNAWNEKYEDDGLLIIGVHKPEFEFEKDPASVRKAVEKANIRYPVVLDNNDATWNAYDQHYWPAWYLIDADGFIQYKHFGEGAYDETEQKIQDLLAEKDQA